MNQYMLEALEEAKKAYKEDEIPIGAIVVYHDQIIGRGHNTKESNKNPFMHAEIMAMSEAIEYLGIKYLDDCTLYVTLEPCLMCTGAIINARVPKVVFGASNKRYAGIIDTLNSFPKKLNKFNFYPEVESGILEEECKSILSSYFKGKREQKGGANNGI